MTDGESVRAGVAYALALLGRIDVLVNNAGILKEGFTPEDASVFEAPIDLVMHTFATNTVGALRMIEAIIPGMRARGYGRVVNLSSGAGQLSDMGSGFPAYRMSKAALNALTRMTAAELGSGNVKINAMCPGWVRTIWEVPMRRAPWKRARRRRCGWRRCRRTDPRAASFAI